VTVPVTTVLPVTIPVTTEQPAPADTSAAVNVTTPAVSITPAPVETQTQIPVSTPLPEITQSAPVQTVTPIQTAVTTMVSTTLPTTTVPTTMAVNITVIQTATPVATVTEAPAPAGAPTYVPQPSGYALPGRIEAENFKDGGEGMGYHLIAVNSTGGQYRSDPVPVRYSTVEKGYLVNNLTEDAWLAYAVNAPVAGNYTVALQASAPEKTRVQVQLDGVDLCTLEVPGTEVCSLAKTEKLVAIPAGAHILTLKPLGSVNLDYLQFI